MIELLVPFYGPPPLLRLLVDSVLGQTSDAWRLLVVDDRWPGEPVEPWLAALGDDRVRYVRNEANLGVNGNFRRCLDLAEAEYVAFPGCDDVLLPTYVEVVTAAAGLGVDIVQPGVRVIDATGEAVRPLGDRIKAVLRPAPGTYAGEELAAGLARGNWTYFPSLCWRTEAARRHSFAPGMDVVLDLALLLDLVDDGATLSVVDDVCFGYRRHTGSASSLAALDVTRFHEESAFYDAAAGRFAALGWHGAARAARRRTTSRLHAASLVPSLLRRGRARDAGSLLRHALR